jgi:hypothetical protein
MPTMLLPLPLVQLSELEQPKPLVGVMVVVLLGCLPAETDKSGPALRGRAPTPATAVVVRRRCSTLFPRPPPPLSRPLPGVPAPAAPPPRAGVVAEKPSGSLPTNAAEPRR